MATKRSMEDLPIERTDVHGKVLEYGSISVEATNGDVVLTIHGERRSKCYRLTRTDWNLLRRV